MKKMLCLFLMAIAAMAVTAEKWAMPRLSVAHVRTSPGHSSEMSTQALMGMPLRVVDGGSDMWIKVEMPDGYRGFIRSNSLVMMNDSAMREWRSSPRFMVTALDETKVYAAPTGTDVVSDIVNGDILVAADEVERSGRVAVVLPDRRRGWIDAGDCEPLEKWAQREPSVERVLEMARRQLGVPYTWGGNSTKGMDCSGLVKMAYLHAGLILQRDAWQQALHGLPVASGNLQPGDLVFYGNHDTGHVDHVAIYVGDDTVIESAGLVRYNRPACGPRYLCSRRVVGVSPSDGIIPLRLHPLYF